jgi:hypothetical protein
MSAFLCSDRHTAVVALLLNEGCPLTDRAAVMTKLRSLNNKALAHRYGSKPQRLSSRAAALEAGKKWLQTATQADRYEAVACFTYQCCEGTTMCCPLGASLLKLERALNDSRKGQKSNVWSI